MSTPVIQIEQLTHQFGLQKVLDNISLKIPQGSVFGFIGPNGAGKTTTLRLLLGLIKKQQGNITIFGKDLMLHRIETLKKTGALIEQPSTYLHLTGKQNLEISRLSYGCNKERINEVLRITGLSDAASKKVKAYSLGMKQRLALAIALLHQPELLILDEPTNGLDPNGIIEMRETIKTLNNSGTTIIVSSHLLSEVEKIATDVGIIHHGKIVFQGTMTELQNVQHNNSVIEIEVNDTAKAISLLEKKYCIRQANKKVLIDFENKEQAAFINTLLVTGGLQVSCINITQNDLENLFIQITSV